MNIHEWFETLGRKEIERFPHEGREEDLHLEFKTVASSDLTNKEDKKHFAKALSGFANSSGGLVVWGIEARKKNAQAPDCAVSKKEIDNVALFHSKLLEFTGQFVSPVVEGVKHKKIRTQDGKGYVVTLIPESDSGPHMAKGGENRYWKRSGDSFYKMEHFDIEDMFGRRKKPKLALHTLPTLGSIGGMTKGKRQLECNLVVGIENAGRGTARYPYLSIIVKTPYSVAWGGLDGRHHEGLRRLVVNHRAVGVRYGADANTVIHPGSVLEVAIIKVKVPEEAPQSVADVEIEWEISAEDMISVRDKLIIKASDIAPAILPRDE